MKYISLTKNEKKVLLFEIIFIFTIIIYLFFFTLPKGFIPVSGMTISNDDFVFEISNGEKIILSPNEDFSNSIFLNRSSYVTLAPGKYYWKVIGRFRDSEIKSFVINEVTGIELNEKKENYEIRNSGNTDLNISEKDGTKKITSGIILRTGQIKFIEKNNFTYEARKNE
jgi:hypothetical protein